MAETANTKRMRSIDIVSLLSGRTAWRLMRGMVRAPFDEDYAGSPLAVCWFTNFSCNAKCHFCCKASEIRAGKEEFPPLSMDECKRLMEKIRKKVNLLYLSGGEPSIHPRILDILREAKAMDFASVGISSNLIALDKKPEILDYVDAIGVSVHSPDVEVHARNLGVSVKLAEKVFENLEMLEKEGPRQDVKVLVNCVINLQNMDTVQDMIEFTRTRGFLLEVVPANDQGRTPTDLYQNSNYTELIDTLLALRKTGKARHLAGSSHYYKAIRDFVPFRCYPYGVPNIMPDGRLCTPCDVSGQYLVNVLDHKDIKAAVKASKGMLGDYPCKSGKCFKAGILERSRMFGLLVAGKSIDDL